MRPVERVTHRTLVLGVLIVVTFVVGYLGQGIWRIGARAAPAAVSAVATEVIGGAGDRQPVRVRVAIVVANHGPEEIRVIGPQRATAGVAIVRLDPRVLVIPAGRADRLNADTSLSCDRPVPLALPALQIQLIDGSRRQLDVGGSGLLLDACSRAAGRVRPLAVASTRVDGEQLVIELSSPTGRLVDITAIRADGVSLAASPLPVSFSGQVAVRLTAPRSCPVQWQVGGIPGSLALDLAATVDAGTVATVRLRIGPALTSWLLTTACEAS
jgi:hypothetical protein